MSDSPFEPQEGEPFTEVPLDDTGSSPTGNPLGAVAYSQGAPIQIGPGGGKRAQKALDHETTHVIQQAVPIPFGGDKR